MTYELERQQKERKIQFESEMVRRIEDLRIYQEFIKYTNHSHHAGVYHNELFSLMRGDTNNNLKENRANDIKR